MDLNTFKLLSDVVKHTSCLSMSYIETPDGDLSCVDAGLRNLFPNSGHLYDRLRYTVFTELSFGTILHLQDSFLMHYVVFHPRPTRRSLCTIGPFLTAAPNLRDVDRVKKANALTRQQLGLWHAFVKSLPCLDAKSALAVANRMLMTDYGAQTWLVKNIHIPHSDADEALPEAAIALKEVPRALTAEQYSPFIQKLLSYIQQNLNKKLDLHILSDYVGFSETYISHRFKTEVGISPIHYITSQRIRYAQHLLTTTDKTVQEVANAVGITDWSYFAKLFRQHTSMTPSQFRKQ